LKLQKTYRVLIRIGAMSYGAISNLPGSVRKLFAYQAARSLSDS
jgi:hypothetical protein